MRDRKTGDLRPSISSERRNNLAAAAEALFLGLDVRTLELRDQRDPTKHASLERWAQKARLPFGTLRHHATDLRPLFWTTQYREERDDGSHRATGPARRCLKPQVLEKTYAGDPESFRLFAAAQETAKRNHAALEQIELAKSAPVGLPGPAFPPRPKLQPVVLRPSPSRRVYEELEKMRVYVRSLDDVIGARAYSELLSLHTLEECAAWWVRFGTSEHASQQQHGGLTKEPPAPARARPQPPTYQVPPAIGLRAELRRMREHLGSLDDVIAARAYAELLACRSLEACTAWWTRYLPAAT